MSLAVAEPPPIRSSPPPTRESVATPARRPVTRDTVETVLEGVPARSSLVELAKPRIAAMVLVSVAVGYVVASVVHGVTFSPGRLLVAFAGVAMASMAAAVLNQAIEHRTDAMMARTAGRPIPSGRVSVAEALLLALLLGPWGLGLLAVAVHPLCAIVTGLTLLSYAFVYTPLKRRTAWATLIGAIPGAAPPVIGAAATGVLGWDAAVLFAVLFFWQVPHFLAIAWKYRDQYAAAGLKMLPPTDAAPLAPGESRPGDGRTTGRLAALTGWALVPTSLALIPAAGSHPVAAGLAAAVSTWYAWRAQRFAAERTAATAVRLLIASFLHLPAVLAIIAADALLR